MIKNRIVKKITYKKSVFEINSKQNISCCIVIPFDENYTYCKSALNKNNDNSKDKISYCVVIPFGTDYNSIDICRKDIKKIVGWNYDEIIISKKDYEKLLHKTKKLKIFNKLNPELNLNLLY